VSKISLAPDASGTGIFTIASPNSNTNRTLTLPDATGTVVISGTTPSLNGITFPATQVPSADANTLDDYEEGTWTPVYTGSGGSIGSTAYTARAGTYTKIGNVVTVGLQLLLSNKGSWTGTVVITGLPFTAANDGIQSIGGLQVNDVTFADQINLRVGPNEATIVPRINTSGAGGDFLQTTFNYLPRMMQTDF
jgi:hypothetical protein